jgi:predicted nucleic acid-binding protein
MNDYPIIVDTSVWVDFLNGHASAQAIRLKQLLIDDARIILTPTILQEILQGLREQYYEDLKQFLMEQELLADEPFALAIEAAELYQGLRRLGITIRKSNDCLIAACAIRNGCAVLHKDRDFKRISEHTPLRLL